MHATTIRLPAQLGELLRSARLSRGLTQTDVARQLGVTVQAVSKLERGASKASFDRIHRLCQVLGLELTLQDKARSVADSSGQPAW